MNKLIWIILGGFSLLLLVALIVFGFLGVTNASNTDNESTENQKTETTEGNKSATEEHTETLEEENTEEWDAYFEMQELDNAEKETILADYTVTSVNPLEQEEMLYVFYDKRVEGKEMILDYATEFIHQNSFPFTVYFTSNEESLVASLQVLEALELPLDLETEDPICIVIIKNNQLDHAYKLTDLKSLLGKNSGSVEFEVEE